MPASRRHSQAVGSRQPRNHSWREREPDNAKGRPIPGRRAPCGSIPESASSAGVAPAAPIGHESRVSPLPSNPFQHLSELASRRYRPAGITAWRFARGKLRGDPVYRAVWEGPWIQQGTIVDLGCGPGLMLALFVSAQESGEIDPMLAWRKECRLVGIETRSRVASIARLALGSRAEIISADARQSPLPRCRTVLLFDVLHMMPASDQETLLQAVLCALAPNGVILIREANAAAGWRFHVVRFANRMKALLKGYSSRGFHFRSTGEWSEWLQSHALDLEVHPMNQGTPFGNVLLVARRRTTPLPSPTS